MNQHPNLTVQRNELQQNLFQHRLLKQEHHASLVKELQNFSLFYNFPQSQNKTTNSFFKNNNGAQLSQLTSKESFRSKERYKQSESQSSQPKPISSGQIIGLGSTLTNFKKTIILDSLADSDHVLNKVGQNPYSEPFVPYFHERDKLGRLVKDPKKGKKQKEKVMVEREPENNIILEQEELRESERTQEQFQVKQNHENQLLTPSRMEEVTQIKTPGDLPQDINNNNAKRQRIAKSWNKNLPSLEDSSRKHKRSNNSLPSNPSQQAQLKLNQLVGDALHNQTSSMQQYDAVTIEPTVSRFPSMNADSFFGKNSFNQSNSQDSLNHNKTSLGFFNNRKGSFTYLINSNQPSPSPSKIVLQLQTPYSSQDTLVLNNTNSISVSQPFLFDKNNHLKCKDDHQKDKSDAFNEKHLALRTKKTFSIQLNQKKLPKKRTGLLKLPESVQSSPFFRVLFNHHKKVQSFNKMIDRNDFQIHNSRENSQEDKQQAAADLQNTPKLATFQRQKKKDKQNEKQHMEYVQSSEGSSEGPTPFKNRLFKSVKSNYQREEEERQMRQNIFKEYDKWFTKQMYYQEMYD